MENLQNKFQQAPLPNSKTSSSCIEISEQNWKKKYYGKSKLKGNQAARGWAFTMIIKVNKDDGMEHNNVCEGSIGSK